MKLREDKFFSISQLLLNVEWKYWRESRRRWRLDIGSIGIHVFPRAKNFCRKIVFCHFFKEILLKNENDNLKWQLSWKMEIFKVGLILRAWPQNVFLCCVGQTFKLREESNNWCMMPKGGYNFKHRSITDYSNPAWVTDNIVVYYNRAEHWFCFFLQVMLLNQTRPHRASWR